MPKLSAYRRIITNDFEADDRKLVGQLSSPINDSFNNLYFALNGRLTLSDNLFATVKDVDVIVGTNGVPTTTTSFSLDKQGQVIGTQVLVAINQVNSVGYPTAQPFISFTQNNLTVFINHISGLQPNQRYTIRIVAYLS